jgi:hypothetical protein
LKIEQEIILNGISRTVEIAGQRRASIGIDFDQSEGIWEVAVFTTFATRKFRECTSFCIMPHDTNQ